MSRYSFTGSGDILLRATVDGKYNGVEYKANQPILYLTGVNISLLFSSADKVARAGVKNLTGAVEAAAATLSVSGIKTSEGLQSLLYRKEKHKTGDLTEVRSVDSKDGEAMLPINISDTVSPEIFVFKKGILIEGYTFDGNTIFGLEDGTYTIFYKKEMVSEETYYFKDYSMPYCAAEIQIVGNVKGKTGRAVVKLDKMMLLTEPSLDFVGDDPFVDSLDFAIMSKYDQVEIHYYG